MQPSSSLLETHGQCKIKREAKELGWLGVSVPELGRFI